MGRVQIFVYKYVHFFCAIEWRMLKNDALRHLIGWRIDEVRKHRTRWLHVARSEKIRAIGAIREL